MLDDIWDIQKYFPIGGQGTFGESDLMEKFRKPGEVLGGHGSG
jgi:hypothetical protein